MKTIFKPVFSITALLIAGCCYGQPTKQFSISPQAGFNISTMRFSIAGNLQGTSPNILSELSWTNLQYVTGGINAGYSIFPKWDIYAGFIYGNAIRGSVADIDYAADNRKGIMSELYHSGRNSNLLKANAGLAFSFLRNKNWLLKAGVDYTLQKQKLCILNYPGSNYENDDSYVEGLHSYYKAYWNQYGVTASAAFRRLQTIQLSISSSFSYSAYQAYGNWNMKQPYRHPKSFEHKSNGFSIRNRFTIGFNKTKKIRPFLVYGFDFLQTSNGVDKLYFKSGRTAFTKLNETLATAHSFATGIQIVF